jgi:hypothetical protein
MSASIAVTAVITAVRAAINPRMAVERPATPSLALKVWLTKAAVRAREPDPEHDREASDLVFQGHPLTDELFARDDQRAERMSLQRLHMHGLEEAGASQVRQPSRVIAVGFVSRKRLERLVGLPALHAHHGEAEAAQSVEQDRHHAPGLEHDATTTRRLGQLVSNCLCRRDRLALVDNRSFAIENTDVGLVHRDIEASKILH